MRWPAPSQRGKLALCALSKERLLLIGEGVSWRCVPELVGEVLLGFAALQACSSDGQRKLSSDHWRSWPGWHCLDHLQGWVLLSGDNYFQTRGWPTGSLPQSIWRQPNWMSKRENNCAMFWCSNSTGADMKTNSQHVRTQMKCKHSVLLRVRSRRCFFFPPSHFNRRTEPLFFHQKSSPGFCNFCPATVRQIFLWAGESFPLGPRQGGDFLLECVCISLRNRAVLLTI